MLHGLMDEYIDFFVNRSFALFTCAGTSNNLARTLAINRDGARESSYVR